MLTHVFSIQNTDFSASDPPILQFAQVKILLLGKTAFENIVEKGVKAGFFGNMYENGVHITSY